VLLSQEFCPCNYGLHTYTYSLLFRWQLLALLLGLALQKEANRSIPLLSNRNRIRTDGRHIKKINWIKDMEDGLPKIKLLQLMIARRKVLKISDENC